jgi:hypothetical protein
MIRALAGFLFAGLAGLFALAFHERYWRWRDCFNELGRCYDAASHEVFLEQAGIAWGSLTVICFAIAMALLIRALCDWIRVTLDE